MLMALPNRLAGGPAAPSLAGHCMITNRHRGLVRIHGAAIILAVAVFFWVYAEFIMRYVPVVRLSREVNLLPYFLCVIIGLWRPTASSAPCLRGSRGSRSWRRRVWRRPRWP